MTFETKAINCNNCGANSFEVIFEQNKAQIHRIVKCDQCGLMYANPQTTHEVAGKAAAGNFPTETLEESQIRSELSRYTPENDQYLKKQFVQMRDYDKVLDFLEAKINGNLLEIGSFAGVFLNAAKNRGWEVTGIEPMLVPALYAETTFGLKIVRGTFEHTTFPPNSFNAITSFHVIEHVYDPTAFVTRVYSLLRRDGILVLETPTYDTIMFKVLKHRERSIRCPGHLYFYTQESLRSLVEKCGFAVIKQEKVGRTLTLDRLFTNFGIITGKKAFFDKISRHLNLEDRIVHINMGDMQRIYCQKI